MVTEWARVEDPVRLLVVLDCLIAEVNRRLGSTGCESCGILVHIVEIVLRSD